MYHLFELYSTFIAVVQILFMTYKSFPMNFYYIIYIFCSPLSSDIGPHINIYTSNISMFICKLGNCMTNLSYSKILNVENPQAQLTF